MTIATLWHAFLSPLVWAEPSKPAPLRLGYIGSLSSLAANYGQAVLDGARMAAEELQISGEKFQTNSNKSSEPNRNHQARPNPKR